MSTYTPGPWNRGYGNYVYQGANTGPNQRLIAVCEVPKSRTQEDWDQVWANARLLAAAPELHQLLVRILSNPDNVIDPGDRIDASSVLEKVDPL